MFRASTTSTVVTNVKLHPVELTIKCGIQNWAIRAELFWRDPRFRSRWTQVPAWSIEPVSHPHDLDDDDDGYLNSDVWGGRHHYAVHITDTILTATNPVVEVADSEGRTHWMWEQSPVTFQTDTFWGRRRRGTKRVRCSEPYFVACGGDFRAANAMRGDMARIRDILEIRTVRESAALSFSLDLPRTLRVELSTVDVQGNIGKEAKVFSPDNLPKRGDELSRKLALDWPFRRAGSVLTNKAHRIPLVRPDGAAAWAVWREALPCPLGGVGVSAWPRLIAAVEGQYLEDVLDDLRAQRVPPTTAERGALTGSVSSRPQPETGCFHGYVGECVSIVVAGQTRLRWRLTGSKGPVWVVDTPDIGALYVFHERDGVSAAEAERVAHE